MEGAGRAGPGGAGPGGEQGDQDLDGAGAGWGRACDGAQRTCFTKGLWAHPQMLATSLTAGPGGDVAKPSRAAHPQSGVCYTASLQSGP